MKPKIPDFNITEPYYQGVTVDPVDYDLQGYDFSILNASLDKQEKRMEAAQEKLAGIDAALGEFKQKVIDGGGNYEFIDKLGDEVANEINHYIGIGDYQGAKNAATRAAAKVVNNTELTARIKTSEQKRNWDARKQKLVDAGRINPIVSEYLDDMNTYYHNNKTKDGKVVGAEDWKGDELYDSWNAVQFELNARDAIMAEKSSGGSDYNVDANNVVLDIRTANTWNNEQKTAERISAFSKLMIERDPNVRFSIGQFFNAAYHKYDKNLEQLKSIEEELKNPNITNDEEQRLIQKKNELTVQNYGLEKDFKIVNGHIDVSNETIDSYMFEKGLPEVAKQLSYNWKSYTDTRIGDNSSGGSKSYSDLKYNAATGKVSFYDTATKQRIEMAVGDFSKEYNITVDDVKKTSDNLY